MWTITIIAHPTRFTLRLGLNSSGHRHQKVGSLQQLRQEERGMTGVGRVKKACVKTNSLLVSFCVISCTVGYCCTHCIYSKSQCHTPLWKSALRNMVYTHPSPAVLSSLIHAVLLLAHLIHFIFFLYLSCISVKVGTSFISVEKWTLFKLAQLFSLANAAVEASNSQQL